MTTNAAAFAREFYTFPLFLPGWHIEKMPDGGLKYSTPPFGEFWSDRNVQATVDEQGKINFVTYSFFERLKYALSLSPDQNLIAAHRRLKALDQQQLQQEIHREPVLENNLRHLNKVFEQANGHCFLLVKIVNLTAAFFHWRPIEPYNFSTINVDFSNNSQSRNEIIFS